MFGTRGEVYRLLFKSSTGISEVIESLKAVSDGVDLSDEIETLERARGHVRTVMDLDERIGTVLERTFSEP